MKKSSGTPVALMIATVLFLGSCSKSSVYPVSTSASATTPAALTTALTAGSWVLSSFTQKTEDKTSKFTDVVFTFSADGTVTATKNGTQTKGSWQYTPAVTYYGSSSKSAIALSMGSASPFDLLTKTWNFISLTATTLKVDSPELAEDEHVQFNKK